MMFPTKKSTSFLRAKRVFFSLGMSKVTWQRQQTFADLRKTGMFSDQNECSYLPPHPHTYTYTHLGSKPFPRGFFGPWFQYRPASRYTPPIPYIGQETRFARVTPSLLPSETRMNGTQAPCLFRKRRRRTLKEKKKQQPKQTLVKTKNTRTRR